MVRKLENKDFGYNLSDIQYNKFTYSLSDVFAFIQTASQNFDQQGLLRIGQSGAFFVEKPVIHAKLINKRS